MKREACAIEREASFDLPGAHGVAPGSFQFEGMRRCTDRERELAHFGVGRGQGVEARRILAPEKEHLLREAQRFRTVAIARIGIRGTKPGEISSGVRERGLKPERLFVVRRRLAAAASPREEFSQPLVTLREIGF